MSLSLQKKLTISLMIKEIKRADKEVEVKEPFELKELVRDPDELLGALEKINDNDFVKRALKHHGRVNKDWPNTWRDAFLLNLPQVWDEIAKRLRDTENTDKLIEALKTVLDESDKYPLQYLWLVRRGILGGDLPEEFNAPDKFDLFKRMFWVINKVQTQIERGKTRLKDTLATLRTSLTEKDARLLTTTLDGLTEERAGLLMHEIEHCRGLSETGRTTLREVVGRVFPKLRVGASLSTAALAEEEQEILATRVGLQRREAELRNIHNEELPEVGKAIGEALAMGDISENAELDAAREKESRLKQQAREISEELEHVRVVEPSEFNSSTIGFGSRVSLKRADGEAFVYDIFGRYEADYERGIINIESPIAQALLGRKSGDDVEVETVDGKVKYNVQNVEIAKID